MVDPQAMTPLMFLLKLAWDCRYRIPLLITIGFMALDIRMQFELNVQTRRVRRVSSPPSGRSSNLGEQNSPENHEETAMEESWLSAEEASDSESDLEVGANGSQNQRNVVGSRNILADIFQTSLFSLTSL
ncbi:hypothetical protein WA026_000221 [Henosepilachna vigintioctopunctata]|uniref:Uncharacterized protein n=1 Tax=Henosepilachna vigintioctopunctata TaxID=420089 RepID=A0AAW1UYK2_9CUCU